MSKMTDDLARILGMHSDDQKRAEFHAKIRKQIDKSRKKRMGKRKSKVWDATYRPPAVLQTESATYLLETPVPEPEPEYVSRFSIMGIRKES
jgi:hypothetical protein